MPRISGGSWQGGAYLFVEYSIVAQSVEGNYTDILYNFGIHFGSYHFNSQNRSVLWSPNLGSGGDSYSSAPFLPWPHGGTNQDYIYTSRSFRVFHLSDGRARISVHAQLNPSAAGGGGTRTVGGTFDLPNIPRNPGPPTLPVLTEITSSEILVTFMDGDSALPIDSRQIGYNINNSAPNTILPSDGSTLVTGLTSNTTYYFWARTHNSAGYSGWSGPVSATTTGTPRAPSKPVPNRVLMTQTTVPIAWIDNDDGGSEIIDHEIGYGTDPVTPTDFVNSVDTEEVIVGLEPNTKYYFWVRAINPNGNGAWSPPANITTVAGARVLVAGVWKPAVPYVRVAGVWKLAQPWVKVMGTWRETR